MNPPATTPTAAQLLAVPLVQDELEAAWYDSQPGDPVRRHEEGGWIYYHPTQNDYQVRRADRGG